MEYESSNSLYETNDSSIESSIMESFICLKTEDLISYISDYCNKLIEQNKKIKINSKLKKNDVFYSKSIPDLGVNEFLNRIKKYSDIEDITLISAFIYIKKFIEKNNYIILKNNIHRILIASCTIAIKFLEDSNYKNSYMAKIGGLSLENMNKIEYFFYTKLNFDLSLNENDFKEIEEQFLILKEQI